jgi:DNA-binding transcriptional MerR regulator
MNSTTALTVGAAARLAGVTVRTLHHYDEIHLVSPINHTDTGYRLYGQMEMERLQEVLFFRELGFGLAEILRIIEEPGHNRAEALGRQRDLLLEKSNRLVAMVEAIDKAIEADRRGIEMTAEELFGAFGDFDPAAHRREVEERWGKTDAYRESNRRVVDYSAQDWLTLRSEADAINEHLLDLMAAGVAAESSEARNIAEEHRAHITKWFYQCSPEIHAGLGQMYVADTRFTENIDQAGEGLAQYLAEAIAANHART